MDYDRFLDRQFVMTDNKRIDRVRDLYTTFNPHVDLDALKAGATGPEAIEKAKGTYGRFAEAVKYIDPRKE